MDFRMRTLKQNKNNYNSLVQLQRPIDSSFAHSINHSSSRKDLHDQMLQVNESFEGLKLPNWQNSSAIQGINQRIGLLEQRVDRIYLETMGLSQKGDLGKGARNSLSFQNSSEIQQHSLFRHSVASNIAMQRQQIQAHGARCEEIEARQARLEQRLKDWMNSQKQEISYRLHTQTEELKGAQLTKIKRYDFQYDNIKNIIHELQLKLETDMEYKFKSFATVKQELMHSINDLKDQMGRQISHNKQGFTSFVRQIKESFQNLKEALSKDRQNVKQAIFELQSNEQNNAAKAQKGFDNITRSFTQKHDKIQKKISSFRDQWNNFKIINSQQLEEYKQIVINVEANILERTGNKKTPAGDEGNSSDEIKEEFSEWRKLTEQKNLNLFREITNAIKVQRLQWRKQHDEMQESMQENVKIVKQLKSSLNKKIQKASTEVNTLLKQSIQGTAHKLEETTEFINIIKNNLEEKIAKSNAKLTENLDKQFEDFKRQFLGNLKELQNKELAVKKDQQNNLLEIKEQLTNIKIHSDTQLENLAKSIAEDNEQWQLQLKANQKKLKESIFKQIEDSSSSKQQLFEAKFNQIQNSLQAIKKYAEKGLINERNETVQQILKVTEELTSLINDWSLKGKKEKQSMQSNIKEQFLENKKSITKATDEVRAIAEEFKKKNQQKQVDDEKKSTELKNWVEQVIAKNSKNGEEDVKTISKKIDTLKVELQGRVKSSADKLLLEINLKKQIQAKAKEEEKSKLVEQEKKIADLFAKSKAQFSVQISKISKLIEDQSSRNMKKSETLLGSLKKQTQVELEKFRKYSAQQSAKLKEQLQLKIKAKEEKTVTEQNSRRQIEVKQKEQQLKAKFAETDKKLIDSLSKLKTQLIGEMGKSKNTQAQEISKVKKQLQLRLKSMDQQKIKKQVEAQSKQQQLKEKEKELKEKSSELDSKLQSTKKDIQKIVSEEIAKAKTQINQKVQKSVIQTRSTFEKQLDPVNKSSQQQKLRLEQVQKKLEELKIQTDKKIAELKGVSLTTMKSQQQEAKKAQDQKLQAIKSELVKLIEISNSKIKQNGDNNNKLAALSELKFAEFSSLLKTHEALINKVEAGLFADRQKNKAIYDKITVDLLDIADSITLILTQMKPAEK